MTHAIRQVINFIYFTFLASLGVMEILKHLDKLF
jgi:hypothetical protein